MDSVWENGKRYPDPTAQLGIFKTLGLNPVELLTGLEIYDEDLKYMIAQHMERIDEDVFISGFGIDEDGNEVYLDLSEYEVVLSDKNGTSTDRSVPYTDYYNVLTPKNPPIPEQLPVTEYDPTKIYINHNFCIFVIPVEILESAGKPLYFVVKRSTGDGIVAIQFTDEMMDNGFDIPEKVYNGKWKGIHVLGDEFGRQLCREMGIRRTIDLVEIESEFIEKENAILLFLDRAKIVNTSIDLSQYLLPQWQYEQRKRKINARLVEKSEDVHKRTSSNQFYELHSTQSKHFQHLRMPWHQLV